MKLKAVFLGLSVSLICGCAVNDIPQPLSQESVTRAKVKPELDYSNETPDCKTAALRIAENIEIGMTLSDVQRLVGKPKWKLPGSWWWSSSLSETGRPNIRYPIGPGTRDVVITGLSSEFGECT